jgi:hypothetical protein
MRVTVAGGANPVTEKRKGRATASQRAFGAIAERFMVEHSRRKKRSADGDDRNLNLHVLPKWKNRQIDDIRRADVIDLVESIVTAGKPVLANRVPVGWPADLDACLIDIEAKIFQHKAAIDAINPEILRLAEIWRDEFSRLIDECDAGRSQLTEKERWAIVSEMPEAKEQERLGRLTKPHYEAADRLVKKMWAIRARTPEGRAAKVRVLIGWLMGSDWRERRRSRFSYQGGS